MLSVAIIWDTFAVVNNFDKSLPFFLCAMYELHT